MSRRTIANKLTSLILAFIMCLTMGFIDGRAFAAEDTAETSEMITDIDLSGEEVDVDGEEFFVDDVTVRYSLDNDAWIQRAEITINEEEAAYKTYEDDTTLQLEDSLIIPADFLNNLKSEDRVLECILTVTDVDGATYSSDFELPFYQYIDDAIVDKDNDEDIERLGDSSKTKAKK